MSRKSVFLAAVLAAALSSTNAFAGVWFELLYAPCWTGNEANVVPSPTPFPSMGEYRGSIDCFNKDFNGAGARTVLSIKAFQPWEYGTMFLYYDITGPFTSALVENATGNEKGGFFGGITLALSAKKIGEKITGNQFNWGLLYDVSVKYEMEHVAQWGMLHYYGLQWDLAVPWLDFLSATTVIRNDPVFEGMDLQIGLALQKSFSLAGQDFMFGGFLSWGVFGEGQGRGSFSSSKGAPFFVTQPQLLWDLGKAITFTPAKLYVGFEYQLAFNRYLIENKTENVLQGMVRWNI